MKRITKQCSRQLKAMWRIALAAALLTLTAHGMQAQTATAQGNLGSFDVINDTGLDVHGFEIQIEGALANDLYYTGFGQRYGAGQVIPYPTGVRVRWESPYDFATHQYSKTTPHAPPGGTMSWNDCYLSGSTYGTSGCENFGQGMRSISNITAITGRWLVEDPANPGTLISHNPNVAIPFPNWFIGATVVTAVVKAPEPPEAPELFGEAQWMKTYVTQFSRSLTAADLNTNGASVPQDPTKIEVAWDIIQAQPASNSNGNQTRGRKTNSGSFTADTRSIIRRYETYKFTGTYDAITHEALCADLTCTAPSAGELGDQIGASNAAVNIIPDAVFITKSGTGAGKVDSSDRILSCGSKCSSLYTAGTSVTLTASPSSGSTFGGWSGACAGTAATCTVAANGALTANALFNVIPSGGGGGGGGGGGTASFTLSVGRSNSGTVTGTPSGTDRALNCGSQCSAKFNQGTVVTLTAAPPAGKAFLGWGGACSGTALTCTVTVNASTSVQANFSK